MRAACAAMSVATSIWWRSLLQRWAVRRLARSALTQPTSSRHLSLVQRFHHSPASASLAKCERAGVLWRGRGARGCPASREVDQLQPEVLPQPSQT
jgi:hypothetical protein